MTQKISQIKLLRIIRKRKYMIHNQFYKNRNFEILFHDILFHLRRYVSISIHIFVS